MHIGEKIRAARKLMGWKQDRLGKELGVGQSAVSNWERKLNEPDVELIPEIARLLNRPVEWFQDDPQKEALESRLAEMEKKLESMAGANVPQAMVEKGSKREELLALIASVPDSRIPALIGWTNTFINRKSDDVEVRPPVKNPSGE